MGQSSGSTNVLPELLRYRSGKRRLPGRGSGVGRDQQVSGPVRRESLLDADRGWDGSGKSQAPQEEKACWLRFGGGTRPASLKYLRQSNFYGSPTARNVLPEG